MIPYLVCESDAWAAFGTVVNLKTSSRQKLFDSEKLVFEAPEAILDIAEVNQRLLILTANEVIFLSK